MAQINIIRNVHGNTALCQLAYDEYQKELNERRALGRYTLDEAALALEQGAGESATGMLKKLMKAAGDGVLPVYDQGMKAKWEGETGLRCLFQEAYWNDLNIWLKANHNKIQWEFPAPAAKPKSGNKSEKPWLTHNPPDPIPEQPWYTPARYFARQLVAGDSTLLIKRDLLASKVVQSLTAAGFYKRGGGKPLVSDTVKKAFTNVNLG